jgi:hypothetical protein
MPSEDKSAPIGSGPEENALGWLLQPTWEKDLFGEIADAPRMTPGLLSEFEKALIESENRPPLLASSCQSLTKCGTFEGSCEHLQGSPCPGLKECDKFTGTAIVGTVKGTKVGTVKSGVIRKKTN